MVEELEHLTDEELRSELTKHGINAGPITPTTKKVYLKKLKHVVGNGQLNLDDSANGTHENGSFGNEVDASGDHGILTEDSVNTNSVVYPKLQSEISAFLQDTGDDDDHIESSRILTPEEIRQRRKYIPPMAQRRASNRQKQSFFSYVCLLALGAVLAALFARMFIAPFMGNDKAVHDEI